MKRWQKVRKMTPSQMAKFIFTAIMKFKDQYLFMDESTGEMTPNIIEWLNESVD